MSNHRVIIIGAGISGLTSAYYLKEQGIDSLIIETKNRIGGRIFPSKINDVPIENGAEFFHSDHPLFEKFLRNEPTYSVNGSYGDDLNDSNVSKILESPDPEDGESLLEYLNKLGIEFEDSPEGIKLYALDTDDPEKLLALPIIKEFKELSLEISSEYGDEDKLIPGGYEKLLNSMSENLDINLGEKVRRINYSENLIQITTSKSEYLCRYAIITVPIPVLQSNTIEFIPELLSEKIEAIKSFSMSNASKYIIKLKQFTNSNSDTVLFNLDADIPIFWESSSAFPEMNGSVWTGWVSGIKAEYINKLSEQERNKLIAKNFSNAIGVDITEEIEWISFYDWGLDEDIGGSYSYVPAGVKKDISKILGEPISERLYFAGEATYKNTGFVDGAMESGKLNAERILNKIKRETH